MSPAKSSDGIDAMRQAVRSHLEARDAAHCERVAETARGLAARWDVSADDAEVAGLLHDWSRGDTARQLVEAAEAARIPVLPVEQYEPYLLHARVARHEVEREFPGLSPSVLDAIETHTLGALEMSPLQKAVYIADMIEPQRRFDGVEDLREAAARLDVDACFKLAYARSVAHVVERGKPLHPVTVEVWNEFVAVGR